MFAELAPLLKERTLMLTVARIDEVRIQVNVIPTAHKENDQTEGLSRFHCPSPERRRKLIATSRLNSRASSRASFAPARICKRSRKLTKRLSRSSRPRIRR